MLKETVTYENFNGDEVTEVLYFHFSEMELMELEAKYEGGLGRFIERLSETQNNAEILEIAKILVLESYGVKSDDGNRFIKSEEIRKKFEQSIAYSEMFMKIALSDEVAARFISGIVPAKLAQHLQQFQENPEKAVQDYRAEMAAKVTPTSQQQTPQTPTPPPFPEATS